MQNEAITLALSEIVANGDDLRTTPAMADADNELRASILAHGLLEPLVVRRHDEAWSVVAGHRRHRALRALADAGEVAADAPVNCTILHDDVDRTEAALAENVIRVAMHPADQVTAFKRLQDAGATAADIAARFGLARPTVEKRLRLAALAPEIMAEYRAGNLDQETAQAYATTADIEAQRRVWGELAEEYGFQRAHLVLGRLQKQKLRSDSPLGKFVADEYREAGGAAEATLFNDYSTMSDLALAERLGREKLETIAGRLRDMGWKWVELVDENQTWNVWQDYREIHPAPAEPTAVERTAIEASHKWDADHAEAYDNDALTEEQEAEGARLDEARAAAEAAVNKRRQFTLEQMAGSGVLVYLGRSGEAEFKEGLVRKGDRMPGQPAADDGAAPGEAPKKEKPKGYSQRVADHITELRGGVAREVLREDPALAQDTLTFSMLLTLLTGHTHGFYPNAPMAIRGESNPRSDVAGASDELKAWLADPEWQPTFLSGAVSVGEMFDAYRALPQDAKDTVISEVAARLLRSEPNVHNPDPNNYNLPAAIVAGKGSAQRLLRADESAWGVETFWGKLRKDQIIDEARPYLGDEWAKEAQAKKKGVLAADAAKRMRDHPDWLPKGFDTPRPARAD